MFSIPDIINGLGYFDISGYEQRYRLLLIEGWEFIGC